MSEKFTGQEAGHEAQASHEQHEVHKPNHEHKQEASKPEKDPAQTAHEARAEVSKVERQPDPLEKLEAAEKVPQTSSSRQINKELRKVTLRRELKQIQRKLPAPQRALSRVIHQPAIRAVSEGVGKTVSRPSGLLGGGLVALLGTSAYLYIAHNRGFKYNYGVFLFLFVAGFAIGLILELAVYVSTAPRRKAE